MHDYKFKYIKGKSTCIQYNLYLLLLPEIFFWYGEYIKLFPKLTRRKYTLRIIAKQNKSK